MNDEAALLAAIIADPGDDTVRLVYADWLDEHGGADRAECIRVQVELERLRDLCETREVKLSAIAAHQMKGSGEDCSHCRLAKRMAPLAERELQLLRGNAAEGEWCENWQRWFLDALPPLHDERWGTGYGRPVRGFVESVTCPADWWLEHGDAVRKSQPVTRVELTTWPQQPECDVFDGEGRPLPPGGDCEREYLARRWPGVKFTLPPVRPTYTRTYLLPHEPVIPGAVAGRVNSAPFDGAPPGAVRLESIDWGELPGVGWRLRLSYGPTPPAADPVAAYGGADFGTLTAGGVELFDGRSVAYHPFDYDPAAAGLEETAWNIIAATNQPREYVPPGAVEYEAG